MPMIVITCPSAADASSAKAEAETGTLWGVSLGTTTTVQAKESALWVQATQTRCVKLLAGAPPDWMAWTGAVLPELPWSEQSPGIQASYFVGLMDA